jgi:multiple sugar transport system substrate-binding protein
MTKSQDWAGMLGRRFLACSVAVSVAAPLLNTTALAQSVDLTQWSPEYVKSIAGTATVRHRQAIAAPSFRTTTRAGSATGTPARSRPIRRSSQGEDKAFWEAFKAAYPNIETDVQSIDLQRTARQVPHRAARQCRPDGHPPADPRRHRVRGQGLSRGTEARGRRLQDRGFLARRHEVRDLGRQGLRHPDQQRDHGVHLERRPLRKGRPRSENPPATWDDVVAYSKQIHDKLGIAGYGIVAKQNAGNTPFRFMPSSGPTAAASSTKPMPTRPTRRSASTAKQPSGAAGLGTTCMSATSRCRPRR